MVASQNRGHDEEAGDEPPTTAVIEPFDGSDDDSAEWYDSDDYEDYIESIGKKPSVQQLCWPPDDRDRIRYWNERQFKLTKDEAMLSRPIPIIPTEEGVDVTPKCDGGVIKWVLSKGHDMAKPIVGDQCLIEYVGWLADSTVEFDSNRLKGDRPAEFVIGGTHLINSEQPTIPAWHIVLPTMRLYEECLIKVKSNYGFVEGWAPRVPPNRDLIYTIKLIGWDMEDISQKNDKTILRRYIHRPPPHNDNLDDGMDESDRFPNEDAIVTAKVKGMHMGSTFLDKENFTWKLGECELHGMCEGVDMALMKMEKGETSLIEIKSKHAYGVVAKKHYPQRMIRADVRFIIELIDFTQAKEYYLLDTEDEYYGLAEDLFSTGMALIERGEMNVGVRKITRAAHIMRLPVVTFSQDEKDKDGRAVKELVDRRVLRRNRTFLAASLELARLSLGEKNWEQCERYCTDVLQFDKENVDAMKYRAKARLRMKKYDLAVDDYDAAVMFKGADENLLAATERARRLASKYGTSSKYRAQTQCSAKSAPKKTTFTHVDNFDSCVAPPVIRTVETNA